MHPTSLVPVSVADVQRAASAILYAISQAREQARRNQIDIVMRKRRWFLGPRYTREQAEVVVNDVTCHYMSHLACHVYWHYLDARREELAKKLEAAASLSQDGCVWLNLEDAQTVKGYLAS